MKNKLVKAVVMATLTASITSTLSGCVGSNAVTGLVMKFNLKAVDNRYARGGLNMLLAPVYALSLAADALVFNSIQFWAGKNPIDGKPHIFDTKVKTMLKVNDHMGKSLQKAPIDLGLISTKRVYSTQMVKVNESTFDMNIVYTNGDTAVLRGEKSGDIITYYMDGKKIITTTVDKLKAFRS
ncbi:MAG: DUF3332 family protein [Psychromonas sp.]|nr:DUF3332 family protein [Psychromonas sp.]